MTVAVQTPTISYVENGSTTAFAVPFRYDAPTDLRAVRRAADGTQTALNYGVDYTASPGPTNAGGTLTTTAAAVNGTILTVLRRTARAQTNDYITTGAFTAESHEVALDRAMLVAQEQDIDLGRAVKAATGETGPTLAPLDTLIGKALFFDGIGIVGSELDLEGVAAAAEDAIAASATAVTAAGTATTAAATATAAAATATTKASEADADAATATAKAAEAAASAASAVLAPGTSATSTTSNTIGIGAKSFTIQTGKAFAIGQFVIAARTSAPANWMFGQVTAHNAGTGALTIEVEDSNGAGTFTDWTIALSGPSGSVGMLDLATETTGTLPLDRGGTGATTTAAARAALGLGTMATQGAGAVAITGGSIAGINDLAVADGGTGASSAAAARTNLGLGTMATQAANAVAITGGSIADDKGDVRRLIKSGETSGTLTAASANELVRATGNLTIPASVFAANDSIMVINKSGGAITITQGSGLTLTDTNSATGTRTLANNGVATIWFNSATDAHIFGGGLS